MKLFTPNGSVFSLSEEMNVAARMYSFQMLMNVRIHTVTIGGMHTGKIMLRKIRNTPAPSIIADSSISFGIDFMKPLRMNTEIGVWNAMYGKISDRCV